MSAMLNATPKFKCQTKRRNMEHIKIALAGWLVWLPVYLLQLKANLIHKLVKLCEYFIAKQQFKARKSVWKHHVLRHAVVRRWLWMRAMNIFRSIVGVDLWKCAKKWRYHVREREREWDGKRCCIGSVFIMNVMCVSLLYTRHSPIHRHSPRCLIQQRRENRTTLSLTLAHAIHFVSVKSHSYKQIKKYKMLFLCFVRSGFFSRFYLLFTPRSRLFFCMRCKNEKAKIIDALFVQNARWKAQKNESNYGRKSAFTFPSDAF